MTLSGPGDEGGAAVAQPGGVFRRLDAACLAVFAAATLGLAIWAGSAVWTASDGRLGAPLDDSYIHFQFARSFARLRPFEYAAGLPPVPGATSLLWPALLTPAIWLGAGPGALLALTWVLGFGALFGQASEVYLSSRRFLSQPLAFAAGLLVLSFSAYLIGVILSFFGFLVSGVCAARSCNADAGSTAQAIVAVTLALVLLLGSAISIFLIVRKRRAIVVALMTLILIVVGWVVGVVAFFLALAS